MFWTGKAAATFQAPTFDRLDFSKIFEDFYTSLGILSEARQDFDIIDNFEVRFGSEIA